ncbi:hypothetical protein QT970_11390 [Microcoleus sp. herbarium8]|uniref:hypothetical protein n=1 Tax=Microcoleus sp. herbarium8 TaxID=3055436 RepID=UPI002FD7022D
MHGGLFAIDRICISILTDIGRILPIESKFGNELEWKAYLCYNNSSFAIAQKYAVARSIN